jgi:hypothetical protein
MTIKGKISFAEAVMGIQNYLEDEGYEEALQILL